MKVRFALLADYSNVTREGKINVLGVFDFIFAAQFPATHPEMRLVLRLEADPSERDQLKEIEVCLSDERGEKLLELKGHVAVIDFQSGQMPFINNVLILRNISFPSPGDYQFAISIDGIVSQHIPLKVVLRQATPNQ